MSFSIIDFSRALWCEFVDEFLHAHTTMRLVFVHPLNKHFVIIFVLSYARLGQLIYSLTYLVLSNETSLKPVHLKKGLLLGPLKSWVDACADA